MATDESDGSTPIESQPAEPAAGVAPEEADPGTALIGGDFEVIDPEAREELAARKKAIVELLKGGAKNAWPIGEHIGAIVSRNLATHGGYRDLTNFIARELPAGRTRIKQYRKLQRAFTKAEVAALSVERLSRFFTYRSLTGCPMTPNLADVPIQVPGAGGAVEMVRLADCSQKQLRAAVRHARLVCGRPKSRELAQYLADALKESTGGRVRSTASIGRRRTTVRLSPFALKDVSAVADALRKVAQEIETQLQADSMLVL